MMTAAAGTVQGQEKTRTFAHEALAQRLKTMDYRYSSPCIFHAFEAGPAGCLVFGVLGDPVSAAMIIAMITA